jgi:hypothetical protein
MYFDLQQMRCVLFFDPRIPPPEKGIPGTKFPPPPPPPPDPYAGYTPAEADALKRGKVLSERREADGSCPAGLVEVAPGSKYCMVPDETPEEEDEKLNEQLKLRVPKNADGVCPEGYQPEVGQGGYTGGCILQSYLDEQERLNRGGDGDGGDVGDTGGDTGGDGGQPFYKVCPNGDVVAVGDKCPSVTVETEDMCWGPRGPYQPHPEYGCGSPPDEKGAAGGYVKKGKIKKKKYQAGGIASLTRDPRLGGAVNPMDGYNFGFAGGGMAQMPEYRAGGKLLRGAGDGMSDDIPAVIRGKGVQRAALADGEFVIPADVVSHLGNGSTEAGAKKLYKMMAQIRRARTGKSKQAPRVNPDKYLPRI